MNGAAGTNFQQERDKSENTRVLKSETLDLFQHNLFNSLSLFFVTLVQSQCPSLYILLLNCIPSPSICLFPVICFKLPITRTFFDLPRRFELSGVDCTSMMGYSELSPGKQVCCYFLPWLAWDLRGNYWLFRI